MNIYIIGCFVLIVLVLFLLSLIARAIDNNKKGTLKITVCLATIFSVFLLITTPIALNGKFKADKLYDDYVELLSRINNSEDLTDIEKLQLNTEIDDYNWKINFNWDRLNDFFSPIGNLYEFDYIKIKA
jgi:TM2 domain-containing membrane protein YozV